jgi:GNAT superfamily N-acetyltransferase
MEIRKLAPDDERLLAAAVRLLRDVDPPAPEMFLHEPKAHAFVAIEGDRVVGCAYGHEVFRPEGRWTLILYEIGTDEAARRAGVGRDLLDAFVAFARSKGHRRMRLFTEQNPEAARRLYPDAGGEPGDHDVGYWWVFD